LLHTGVTVRNYSSTIKALANAHLTMTFTKQNIEKKHTIPAVRKKVCNFYSNTYQEQRIDRTPEKLVKLFDHNSNRTFILSNFFPIQHIFDTHRLVMCSIQVQVVAVIKLKVRHSLGVYWLLKAAK
jgi:hypothetical protein